MSLIGIYLRTIWQLARPRTLILIWLHIVLGYLLLTGEVPVIDSVVLALLASAMSYISAVAMNDIADEEVDRLNLIHQRQAADRPIVNQTSSSRQVARIAIVTSLMTIIAGVAIAPWLGGAALLMVLLNAAYSLPPLQISKRGGLAQLLLPLMYVLYPFAIALAVSGQNAGWSYWLMAVGLYLLFVGRLFLKDIRDEVGDRRVGKRTYLVRHGLRPTLLQSAVWLIIGIGCSFAAMLQHTTHVFVLSLVAVIALVGICVSLRACYRVSPLEDKLLYVAMTGRFASMWVFYCLIALVLVYSHINEGAQLLLLFFAVALFCLGIGVLYEELASMRRLRAKQQLRSKQ